MKLLMVKLPAIIGGAKQHGLFPDVPWSGHLGKLGDGEYVTAEIKHPRNIRRHRFYWALCTLVWQNIENELHPTVEDLSDAIKVMVGCRKRFWIPPGTVLEDGYVVEATGTFGYRPGSIAFTNMEEGDFAAFIDRVVDLICKWYMPGLSQGALLKKVEDMCGIKPWWKEEAARTRKTA